MLLNGDKLKLEGREMATIIIFFIKIIVMTILLWVAMRIMGYEGKFINIGMACMLSSFGGLIPIAGGILSLIMFFYLISKFTGIEFWPSGVLVTAIAFAVGIFSTFIFSDIVGRLF